MRVLKYHVALTVDGFIAHEDGSVDRFVHEGEHVTEYLESLRNDYDVVVMGRRTYEFGLRYGVTDPYPWMKQSTYSRAPWRGALIRTYGAVRLGTPTLFRGCRADRPGARR